MISTRPKSQVSPATRPQRHLALATALLLTLSLGACTAGRDDAPQGDDNSPASTEMGGAAGPSEAALRAQLLAAPPARDPLDLALRMGRLESAPELATPAAPAERAEGDEETFWLHDINAQEYFEVQARLEVIRDSAYFWVQDGESFDRAALERGADAFDTEIYPAVRKLFGEEWSPGIDGDPRVHVLHHQPVAGIAGYFYSVDEYPRAVEPHSNEREMFYINLSVYTPGSFDYQALLAHELQHMIHWNHDRNESVWANEGLSELASEVAGYRAQNGSNFFSRPDTALMEWQTESGANARHYAAAYAFFAWLRARFGDEAIRAFVLAEPDGAAGVEAALEAIGQPHSFEDVFLDWAAANAMPPETRRGRKPFDYGSSTVSRAEWIEWDVEGVDDSIQPFGTDYWEVTAAVEVGRLVLDFAGDAQVGLLEPAHALGEDSTEDSTSEAAAGSGSSTLVDAVAGVPGSEDAAPSETDSAQSGASAEASVAPAVGPATIWWSQRGDNIDSRLSREIDLRGATTASLAFSRWQAIEEHWDYAYYRISADGGKTWQALAGSDSVEANPNGNNFGAGLTGSSRGWVEDRLDLSAWAGQEVLLRWELVTDDAVNLEGIAIRDLVLEADGAATPIVLDDALWQAEGWQRVPEILPMRWGLQVIAFGSQGAGLKTWRIPVDAAGRARIDLPEIAPDASVIVAVSGLTPATRQAASYRLEGGGAR